MNADEGRSLILGRSIACVHRFAGDLWVTPAQQDDVVALCQEQPYAPSAAALREYLRSGAESGSKVSVLLEDRLSCHQGVQTKVFGAALWGFGGGEAELEYLLVAPRCRREGWGSVLMDLSHRLLKECVVERCCLEVAESNLHAILLYQALAYETVGRRPRYYRDGQDALVMVKVL
jgi:ribosomal protein S18 acetylase RimI-like enzyme